MVGSFTFKIAASEVKASRIRNRGVSGTIQPAAINVALRARPATATEIAQSFAVLVI
jgi:hypothetical protein